MSAEIVVDVGCRTYGGVNVSIEPLIKRFNPVVLFGFDPLLEDDEIGVYGIEDTAVICSRRAAWTRDGTLSFTGSGTAAGADAGGEQVVECFDLARWLCTLPPARIVLKIDAEGAEYPLLANLHATGVDALIEFVLVEWHPGERSHGLECEVPELRCAVEEWQ